MRREKSIILWKIDKYNFLFYILSFRFKYLLNIYYFSLLVQQKSSNKLQNANSAIFCMKNETKDPTKDPPFSRKKIDKND